MTFVNGLTRFPYSIYRNHSQGIGLGITGGEEPVEFDSSETSKDLGVVAWKLWRTDSVRLRLAPQRFV